MAARKKLISQINKIKTFKGLLPLLEEVYPKVSFNKTTYENVNKRIEKSGIIIKYLEKNDLNSTKEPSIAREGLAYMYRVNPGIFRIFINNAIKDPDALLALDLHEKGHILYHSADDRILNIDWFKENLIQQARTNEKLSSTIEEIYKEGGFNNRHLLYVFLYKQFSNIATDMEINSKLFDDDWESISKIINKFYIKAIINENLNTTLDKRSQTKLDSLKQKLVNVVENDQHPFPMCHPTSENWPEKMSWVHYLQLLVDNKSESLLEGIQLLQKAGSIKGSKGTTMNGQFEESDQNESDGDLEGKGLKEKKEENSPTEEKTSENSLKDFLGTPSKNCGRSITGEGEKVQEIEILQGYSNIKNIIKKICLKQTNARWKSDLFYYSNRGKDLGGVLLPRRYTENKYHKSSIILVVDISGSVDIRLVKKALIEIKELGQFINLHTSRVILCDTKVQGDYRLLDPNIELFSGGGTTIVKGIRYAFEKGYIQKKNDKLIVISDLEDDLSQWTTAVSTKKSEFYAIAYAYENFSSIKEVEGNLCNNIYGRDSLNSFREFKKKFKIFFLNLDKESF